MNLNISSRMIVGFMVMSIVLGSITVISIYYINHIHDVTEKTIIAQNVGSFVTTKGLELVLMEQKGLTTNFLLTSDPQWLHKFEEAKPTFYDWLRKARETISTDEEAAILNQVQQAYEQFLSLQQQVIALHQSGRSSEAYALRLDQMYPAMDVAVARCEQFWAINARHMDAAKSRLAQSNATITRIMYSFIIAGLFLGLLLGILISRSVTKPIYELVLKVRDVTEKHGFIHNIEITNESELEQLGRSVRHLIDRIYQIDAELARNQQILIRSEKLAAAGELAAGIAHEIRNPLTTVKMLVFALEEELGAEDRRREDIRVVVGEIERMERVLQSFLDFARPPAPEFTPMALTPMIKNALTLLHPEMRKQKIRPLLDIPQDMMIRADHHQITQVLINLLRNAMEAMPEGGEVQITAQSTKSFLPEMKRMAQIEIRDGGTGIREDLFPRLFDPFVTGRDRGTGLGLSIAYKIIEIHGGWIEAKNNVEGGATFTVALPMEV